MKQALRARAGYGVLTVEFCRLIVGELCDIIQELELELEFRLVSSRLVSSRLVERQGGLGLISGKGVFCVGNFLFSLDGYKCLLI